MARNWAITVGINGYSYLRPLTYAVRDAEAVNHFFGQEMKFHQLYHFTDHSLPITQDYGPALNSKPTNTTLRRFLRTRFERPFLSDGDNLWFFFAGHGVRDQGRDYLLPIDGDVGDLQNSAIPIHYISECLRRSGADNIILLIDACRSYEGRRAGVGIGAEKQQGVITLFSCSPQESSYEIQSLQQGAFTYALITSLRLQGEGNCATVERLHQRLRYYVPKLTEHYIKVTQTPYGVIEPISKNHLILLPSQATLKDVETLKKDALTTELRQDFSLAKQLWIRVLAVSPADPDALEGLERIWEKKVSNSSDSFSVPSIAHTAADSSQVRSADAESKSTDTLLLVNKATNNTTQSPTIVQEIGQRISNAFKETSRDKLMAGIASIGLLASIVSTVPIYTSLSSLQSTTDELRPSSTDESRPYSTDSMKSIEKGSYLRILPKNVAGIRTGNEQDADGRETSGILVYATQAIAMSLDANKLPSVVPVGSIVRVQTKDAISSPESLVRLQLCSTPSNIDTPLRIQLGERGWALESAVLAASEIIEIPAPSQKGKCQQ